MDELFSFPDADLYQHVYTPAPPSDLSKSILSLPTEIIVDIAQSNFKTALALMCTNRVLHAAGVTALYTRAYLNGSMFQVRNPDAPNLVVPGVLGGLLAKQEHTAALRYLKVLSLPYDTYSRPAFMTLVYRVFERAHGLVYVHLLTWNEFEPAPSPRNNLLQPLYPRNLHTLDLCSPTIPFAQTLLTAPSLKEVRFSHEFYYWQSLLGYDQGPYSQVTSLRYVHRGVEARTMDNVFVEPLTMNDEFLKMCELFPSVERMEVEIVELRNVSRKVL